MHNICPPSWSSFTYASPCRPRHPSIFFFLNDPAPPEISPLPPHAALPINRGQKPSAEFEKSYEKHRKKIVELVRLIHINGNRLEQLKLALYDLNRRLMMLESKLAVRSEEHTSELQSHLNLVCRLLLEKKKK